MSDLEMTNSVEQVLTRVSDIAEKYKEMDKITGRNYNIFSILNLEKREVCHSRFIANLLDPKGIHGQGTTFLKYFLQSIKISEQIANEALNTVKVITEEDIGVYSKDYSEGGRMDIVIKISAESERKLIIVIENKIFAPDQPHQLWRYHQYYPNGSLYYLSLDGHEPSEDSISGINIGEKKATIKCISYKEDILPWLEDCKKETTDHPLLRETLTQYINTIKDLTGQSKNQEMSEEIVSLLAKSSENVAAAFQTTRSMDELQENLLRTLIRQLRELSKNKNIDCPDDGNWGGLDKENEDNYIYFYFPDFPKKIYACFGFDKGFSGFLIGVGIDGVVRPGDPNFDPLSKELFKRLKDLVFIRNRENGSKDYGLLFVSSSVDEFEGDWNRREKIWAGIPNGYVAQKLFNYILQIQERLIGMEM